MPYHYFYIARCSDDSLYSGYTTNIAIREKKHNNGKGAKYTKARLPVSIIYFERFRSKSKAMRREAEVKKLSRSEKCKLITKD